MRLAQNEKRTGAKFAEHIAQAGRIDVIGEQTVRHDEARVRRPGIYEKAPKAAHLADPLPVDNFGGTPEFCFQFIFLLDSHRRCSRDSDEIPPPPQR